VSDERNIIVDGCSYENNQDAFWTGVLGFCSCGSPEQLLPKIIEYLDWCGRDRSSEGDGLDYGKFLTKREQTKDTNPWHNGSYRDDLTLLIAYVCAGADLTEHGTSIGWPWLTDEGKSWLMKLQEDSHA
jgi:hypothetical protein